MKGRFVYRFIFLAIVTCISVMAVIPTFFEIKEESSYPVKSKINLGLDLQGGLYMVLGIDFNKVYRDEIKNYAVQMVKYLEDKDVKAEIGTLDISDETDPKHTVTINENVDVTAAKDYIKEFFSYPVRLTAENGTTLTYGLHKVFKDDIERTAVSKSIEVIRNRIDEFGVTEPEIVSLGNDRVVVQLPGVDDIERAKALIGKTAKLEFKMVNETIAITQLQSWIDEAKKDGIEYKKGEKFSAYLLKLNDRLKDKLPKGHEIAFEKPTKNINAEEIQLIPYLLESVAQVTGDDLQDAGVRIDPQENRPYVGVTFKSAGAKKFEILTENNVNRRMAIVLDGNVYTAPVIQERIGGGNASISLGRGNYNDILVDARDISLVLRAGALPVELDFEEQRIVGPSLGADAIKKAEIGGLIGAVAVFIFILIYYKIAGLFAVMTLILNIVIVLACLVGLEATLTLPGIAGIALTIGMAVDANIIIYERIKEELRDGTHKIQAVESGFSRAFWTILDANLTTAVAGLCLINFGTGPIRGFAVTLLIGIVATVYSSYFVGKLIFEFYMDRTKGQSVSI
jgi:preprotein translocase subunit SecD